MKITILYTGPDKKSYFKEEAIQLPQSHPLGNYSKPFSSSKIQWREFTAGLTYPKHIAPCSQYIVYLEGYVEVKASSGESRKFGPGDILWVEDLEGEGHETTTLSAGKSLVIPVEQTNVLQ